MTLVSINRFKFFFYEFYLGFVREIFEGPFLTSCPHGQQYTVSRETNPYRLGGPVLGGYYLLSQLRQSHYGCCSSLFSFLVSSFPVILSCPYYFTNIILILSTFCRTRVCNLL